MSKEELIQIGESLLSDGLFIVSRDKEKLSLLFSFFDAIGKPLTNKNCSGCISTAIYRLRPEIEALNRNEKPKISFVMSNVKYKLKVPPYRLDAKTVVTNDNLTPEIAAKIIEKYPNNWGVLLEVIEEKAQPKKETTTRKTTTRKKKEEPSKDAE